MTTLRDRDGKARGAAATALAALGAALVIATVSAQTLPPPTAPAMQTSPPPDDPFPGGPGKTALMKICSNCHPPDRVLGRLKTRAEWIQTLDDMARLGAEATDEELARIREYLVAHFSPISVNTATAGELAAMLDLPQTVADALVRYRDAKGPFGSQDDLMKGLGVDAGRADHAAHLDARRKRLVF